VPEAVFAVQVLPRLHELVLAVIRVVLGGGAGVFGALAVGGQPGGWGDRSKALERHKGGCGLGWHERDHAAHAFEFGAISKRNQAIQPD